jgi:hypothetical protein
MKTNLYEYDGVTLEHRAGVHSTAMTCGLVPSPRWRVSTGHFGGHFGTIFWLCGPLSHPRYDTIDDFFGFVRVTQHGDLHLARRGQMSAKDTGIAPSGFHGDVAERVSGVSQIQIRAQQPCTNEYAAGRPELGFLKYFVEIGT